MSRPVRDRMSEDVEREIKKRRYKILNEKETGLQLNYVEVRREGLKYKIKVGLYNREIIPEEYTREVLVEGRDIGEYREYLRVYGEIYNTVIEIIKEYVRGYEV